VDLTVPPDGKGVVPLPGGADRGAAAVSPVALLEETTALLAGGGKTAKLSVLHNGLAHPVDPGVVADDGVSGIHKDDFEVLVGGVLVDPIRVKDAESTAGTAGSLLSDVTEGTLELDLVDTLVLGLSVDNTLRVGSLAATTANTDTINYESLLGLVAEAASLVGTSRAASAVNSGKLPVLENANAEKEAQHIRLLLLPELLKILVCTHV